MQVVELDGTDRRPRSMLRTSARLHGTKTASGQNNNTDGWRHCRRLVSSVPVGCREQKGRSSSGRITREKCRRGLIDNQGTSHGATLKPICALKLPCDLLPPHPREPLFFPGHPTKQILPRLSYCIAARRPGQHSTSPPLAVSSCFHRVTNCPADAPIVVPERRPVSRSFWASLAATTTFSSSVAPKDRRSSPRF